ncbi:MAG: DegV family protein [Clostridia bacterium]|nr:DegV family protein [Clostridia bacterium]
MSKRKYLLIGDSTLDFDAKLNEWLGIRVAPMSAMIDGELFIDDESIDKDRFIDRLVHCKEVPKTSAPSPGQYLELMEEAEEGVFIITVSSRLSASYNSAIIAKDMAAEMYPGLKVHVIDSLAASAGQTTVAIKIGECIDAGLSFEEIAAAAEDFRDHDKLYFLLDNLEILIKNGRMSLLKGMIAMLLKIKPILGDDGDGNICLEAKSLTYAKGLRKLADMVISTPLKTEERTLVISHCLAEQQALRLKEQISAARKFKNVLIIPMRAMTTLYGNIGGLVCAF